VSGVTALPADPTLLAFLALGALGGAHCIGMCGPLVTLYADRMDASGTAPAALRQHTLFNLGRTVSYAAIGAAMGLAGATVFDAAAVLAVADPVRAAAGLVVGAIILVSGLRYAVGRPGHLDGGSLPLVGDAFARISSALVQRVDRWADGPRIAALGALHGVLPCPLLYPAFLYAFATGSPVRGGVALATLGLGTIPTVFAVGVAVDAMDATTRTRLHRALGVVFVGLAVVPLAHALTILGVPVPHLLHG
jgi:sulfite exporter TauE/SafE